MPRQNTWIYERVRAVTPGGMVDVTEELLSGLDVDENGAVELTDGVMFLPMRNNLRMTGLDGAIRTDLETVGGIVRTVDGDAFQIIATPRASRPVAPEDHLVMDLAFLGFEAGTPLLVESAFGQGIPAAGDDAGAGSAELLARRMADNRFTWYAKETESGVSPGLMTVLGSVPAEGVINDASFTGEAYIRSGPYEPDSAEIIDVVGDGDGGGIPAAARPALEPLGELATCRDLPLKCISGYFDSMIDGVAEVLDSLFPTEEDDDCQDCGEGGGEPHMITFDQHRYDMQLVGEFVLAEAPGFQVQIRTEPYRSSDSVSAISAVAVRTGDETFTVGLDRDALLWHNGTPVQGRPYDIPFPGGRAHELPGRIVVDGPDGARAIIVLAGSSHVNVLVDPGDADNWAGLIGSPDGNIENDLTSREGTSVPLDAEQADLYEDFAHSWRITDEESLFDYASGQSTATFTDTSFPTAHVTLADLDPAEVAFARALCRLAGVTRTASIDGCAFDYVITGNIDFVNGTAYTSAIRGEIATGWAKELTGVDQATWAAMVDGDQVLVRTRTSTAAGTAMSVHALDPATGAENWVANVGDHACIATGTRGIVVASSYREGAMIETLDPGDGTTRTQVETALGACNAALATADTVLIRSGDTTLGLTDEKIAFSVELRDTIAGPVIDGAGQVWLVRKDGGAGVAVNLDVRTGGVTEFALPQIPASNISPRPSGFVVGYGGDGGGLIWVTAGASDVDVHLEPAPLDLGGTAYPWTPEQPFATDGEHHATYIGERAVGLFDSRTGELADVAFPSSFENNGSRLALGGGTLAVGLFAGSTGGWVEMHSVSLGNPSWASPDLDQIRENVDIEIGDPKEIGPFLENGLVLVQATTPDGIAILLVGPGN